MGQQVGSAAPTIGGGAGGGAYQNAPSSGAASSAAFSGKFIPTSSMAVFKDAKPEVMDKMEAKLKELNSAFPEDSEHRMNDAELGFLSESMELLKQMDLRKEFKDAARDLIWNKLSA